MGKAMANRRYRGGESMMAAQYFASLSSRYSKNTEIQMFTEDIHMTVMPIGGKTENHEKFSASLIGSTDACERAQKFLAGIDDVHAYELNEVVCSAVDIIARELAWNGCAVYEIIPGEDGDISIHNFTTQRLVRLARWFIQFIPRGDWEYWKKKIVVIPANRIWYVEMPLGLGGRKSYKRILKKLSMFDNTLPRFYMEGIKRGEMAGDFDFQRHFREREVYFRQVTKAWGWNSRDWSQDRTTEFFTFYKMVNFSWAQAILREHIISELNILFQRFDLDCTLIVAGLPTPEEILIVRDKLISGDISFNRAYDQLNF